LGDIERTGRGESPLDFAELATLIRRVVAARVSDRDVVDDIVQEAFVRLLSARARLDDSALGPYGIVIARTSSRRTGGGPPGVGAWSTAWRTRVNPRVPTRG
jgi:hypothetical protein